ncbi:MAG: hypothetical protein NZ958_06160 [Bacteroidia bacterium]|nr:hypothetical protein [Bacteroidia bacterium]MDW8088798.1 hypothetical protein [Bacteroidia bacterium]
MRRAAIVIVLLTSIVLASLWMYRRFLRPPARPTLWQNLPAGFSLVIYTPSFGQSWKQLRRSPLWNIGWQSPHLASFFQAAAAWDSLLKRYTFLAEWLLNRGILIAFYNREPLYLIEAPFLAQIGDWRSLMSQLASEYNWPVRLVEKEGYAMWKLPQGYLAPAGTILVYAEHPRLVARFLSGATGETPPWQWHNLPDEVSPWLFLGWQGDSLAHLWSHPALAFLSLLKWGEARLRLEEDGLYAEGQVLADTAFWRHIAPSTLDVAGLCPASTQSFLRLRLADPQAFYRTYLLRQYASEIQQAESWLGFSFEKQLLSHFSGEIGVGLLSTPFVLLQAKEAEEIQASLKKLARRLAYRTPFTVKHTVYRGYPIQQITLKRFFRWLLGRAFQGWESPYFLQVGEWLVFADSAVTLQEWLDAYLARRNLYERADFSMPSERTLAFFHLWANPPDWLRHWVAPAMYPKWAKELAAWKQATFALLPSTGSTLSLRFQLLWQSDTLLPSSSPPTAPPTLALSDSTKDGLQEEFYPNGVLKRRVLYLEGKPEGEYREYYPNGVIKVEGQYEQGEKVGRWRYYTPQGELLREEVWSAEELPVKDTVAVP